MANRKEAVERLVELADVFSGTIPLTRVEKNGNQRHVTLSLFKFSSIIISFQFSRQSSKLVSIHG